MKSRRCRSAGWIQWPKGASAQAAQWPNPRIPLVIRHGHRPRSCDQGTCQKDVWPVGGRLLLCCFACTLYQSELKNTVEMPTESSYPAFTVPEEGLWDFLFERKDREFPDDKGEDRRQKHTIVVDKSDKKQRSHLPRPIQQPLIHIRPS